MWKPTFVTLHRIDPETFRVDGVVIARVEPDGTLRVAYSGDIHVGGDTTFGQVKAAMRAMPWPSECPDKPWPQEIDDSAKWKVRTGGAS